MKPGAAGEKEVFDVLDNILKSSKKGDVVDSCGAIGKIRLFPDSLYKWDILGQLDIHDTPYQLVVEVDGCQHIFCPSAGSDWWGGVKGFEKREQRDRIKENLLLGIEVSTIRVIQPTGNWKVAEKRVWRTNSPSLLTGCTDITWKVVRQWSL